MKIKLIFDVIMTRGYAEIIQSTQLEDDNDLFNRWGRPVVLGVQMYMLLDIIIPQKLGV